MNGLLLRASCAFCALILNKNHGVGSTGMEWLMGFVDWVSSETFVSELSAEMLVSLTAISVAVWTSRQSQQHAGLSVIPAFSVWADYPSSQHPECIIRISNKGFGPAIFERTELFNGPKRVTGYRFNNVRRALHEALGEDLHKCHEVASGENGHAIGAGEEFVLARFTVGSRITRLGDEGFGQKMEALTLLVTYRDIYQRRWYFLVQNFEGTTWRRNSPAHLWYQVRYWRYLPVPRPVSWLSVPKRLIDRYRAERQP